MAQWWSAVRQSHLVGSRLLDRTDLAEALAVCARTPVESVLAANRIYASLEDDRYPSQVWGFPAHGPLKAICWIGANIVPVIPLDVSADEVLDEFATVALREGRRASSIVGSQTVVMGMWARIESRWSEPRDIRANQLSLMIDTDPKADPDPHVRRSTSEEFDVIFPACVAMFTEEVGYSPISKSNTAYADRVRALIQQGRSYVRFDPVTGEVMFKAEIGATGPGIAQIQGVWVPPALRGQGLAAPGVAAVVLDSQNCGAHLVSLYVNDFNAPALATYTAVGFEQVGVYTSILF